MLICMCLPRMKSVSSAPWLVKLWAICVVVQDNQHLVEFLHLQLLRRLGDLALPLDDAPQRCLVPLVAVGLLPFSIHRQVLLDVLLDGDPAVVDVYAGTEYIDFLKDSAVLLQNPAAQRHGLAGPCWGRGRYLCMVPGALWGPKPAYCSTLS